jgi:two-component system, chemotaxis family, chemotaxis protein CheY
MKKRVLVVEDDLGFRKLLHFVLSQAYEVTVVENGQEAVETLQVLPVNLIVTDIDMPEMNGVELISFLKGHAVYQQIPVMVLSSFKPELLSAQISMTDIVGYFEKPLELKKLKESIDSVFRESVMA